ncbi:UNKNOWN [Stylonychia lemnae]|uniref:Uncharacterized protein n=1 Tax=Stylonychia lemnae TaxID=5949 RepID=A0A078AVW4_STYLE|nr:UNKNOWN [Stylonychia lemnae]|eukprot:CDW86319.1 UNKNOWN [Stylonychia lemnae]
MEQTGEKKLIYKYSNIQLRKYHLEYKAISSSLPESPSAQKETDEDIDENISEFLNDFEWRKVGQEFIFKNQIDFHLAQSKENDSTKKQEFLQSGMSFELQGEYENEKKQQKVDISDQIKQKVNSNGIEKIISRGNQQDSIELENK